MSSNDFGAYHSRTEREDHAAVHINIDDNMNNRLNIPANVVLPNLIGNNENPSTRFHTMFNRVVREHTNVRRNSRFMNVISPIARSLIANSNGFRSNEHTPLAENNHATDNVHILFDNGERRHSQREQPPAPSFLLNNSNNEHSNMRVESNNIDATNQAEHSFEFNHGPNNEAQPLNEARLEDDNNNVFSDILVRLLGNFVRYLPFLVILFVKFIHDHLLGILDITILQLVIWFINKSLSQQVSKLSQKKIFILIRDFVLVAATITYRLLLTSSKPDPFGLIINPPAETVTIEVSSTTVSSGEQSSALNLLNKYLNSPSIRATIDGETGNAIHITRAISLGLLIYYIAVNDLLLKLLTIWTKILITMLPSKLLRHSQRARMYVLVEYFSQFYRSLVPMRQWITFLFKSYTGLEVISGILFSAFYMGAKGFEFVSRGKVLHNAFVNFIRNMDYERKPTKIELDTAGQICPICHDAYNTPVILTCNHIFCDDCVGQWFKREQTCPMCRAKVSEDPQWQDGSTTFFYQLC